MSRGCHSNRGTVYRKGGGRSTPTEPRCPPAIETINRRNQSQRPQRPTDRQTCPHSLKGRPPGKGTDGRAGKKKKRCRLQRGPKGLLRADDMDRGNGFYERSKWGCGNDVSTFFRMVTSAVRVYRCFQIRDRGCHSHSKPFPCETAPLSIPHWHDQTNQIDFRHFLIGISSPSSSQEPQREWGMAVSDSG